MPPKNKFTNNDIIDAAFKIVREKGLDALTARAIALELKSSTKPIYSQIETMEKVKEAVVYKAYDLYLEYLERKITGDKLTDFLMNYVLFAYKEKKLFRIFYDEKYAHINQQYGESYSQVWLQKAVGTPRYDKLNDMEKYNLMLREFIFIHGLADVITYSCSKEMIALRSNEDMLMAVLIQEFKKYAEKA
jgi:AcrR family transcriptional regulator